MKKPKILIVDDDASLLHLYETALSHRGLKVFSACCAEDGLKVIESEKPELVITDIMMPQIHGLHFLDIIKATPETKDQKVMVLTALDDQDTKAQALKYGALDYIVKSQTNMADVLERITEAIENG
jgi:DNA-binding response OmpR family regulator